MSQLILTARAGTGFILGFDSVPDPAQNVKLTDNIIISIDLGPGATPFIIFSLQDPGTTIFPNGVQINFIKLQIYHNLPMSTFTAFQFYLSQFQLGGSARFFTMSDSLFPFISESEDLSINSVSGLPWQRSELFDPTDEGLKQINLTWVAPDPAAGLYTIDQIRLVVDYVGLEVTSCFPSFGGIYGGASIEVSGSGFQDSMITNVFFGTVPASSIFVINDTTLTCLSPAHELGAVFITVQTDTDSATSDTAIFTYEQYTFTLENSDVPVKVGDKIKISTPVAPEGFAQQPGVLNGVQQIQLSYVDPVTGETQTIIIENDEEIDSYYIFLEQEDLIWFYLPLGFRRFHGTITITLVGDGVQFSGSVEVGTLEVLFEDASGIYVLDPDSTSDTLYFRDGFITDISILMLFNLLNDEDKIYEDDFFSILSYPSKILSQTYMENESDNIDDDFTITSELRIPTLTNSVEIPSPFVRTAFLP